MDNELTTRMREIGMEMGNAIKAKYPAVMPLGTDGPACIPGDNLEEITEAMMTALAEAVQSWIDAGSERDAFMDNDRLEFELGAELQDWSDLAE